MKDAEAETMAPAAPSREGRGAFVAVVGPSGAGKDTLLAYARSKLRQDGEIKISFVRRVITREADGSTEDHDTLSPEAFDRAEADGAFALSWRAHGLRYGLPADVDDRIGAGEVVVANLSRAAIPILRGRYPNVAVVLVTASPATLSARLAARGRESAEAVSARLARAADEGVGVSGAFTPVFNDGAVEDAGEALVAAIRDASRQATLAG